MRKKRLNRHVQRRQYTDKISKQKYYGDIAHLQIHAPLPSSPHPTPLTVTISVFFFLSSPAGRIDHGHHGGKAVKALTDAVAMNKAVASALKMVNKGKYFDSLDFILMVFGETWGCSHLSVTQIYIRDLFGYILT